MSTQDHGTTVSSDEPTAAKCPVMSDVHHAVGTTANQHWWPNQLNLRILRQNPPSADPMGGDFDYAEAFESLDFDALAKDVDALMTQSQDWWPADYGHYGPLFIRMTWHSAGTYRIADGRGGGGSGAQRFAPLNSWPDNANLDKARRLLWPIKQKYGRKISWADLLIFAGNRALETMGFKTFGFGGGRVDIWAPEEDVYWGPEREWLGDERYTGDRELANPLGAVQMGLIYVNPEGPNGNPDPLAAARDIRETFGRMAMNDEETVALIAGGHTFGKTHGAADADEYLGPEPEAAGLAEQGLGWKNRFAHRHRRRHDHRGLEGAWTPDPITWDNGYFRDAVQVRMGADQEPRRCASVDAEGHRGQGSRSRRPRPVEEASPDDGHDGPRADRGSGLQGDLEAFLREPGRVRRRLRPGMVQAAAPRHGTCLAVSRPVGSRRDAALAGPGPRVTHELIDDEDIAALKAKILDSGLSISQLVSTAWASASTYRDTDKRGGANGARLRLSPQAEWDVNVTSGVASVLETLEGIQREFNGSQTGGKMVSLADLIVLGGCAAVESAAKKAGHDVQVPFSPGRTDATQEQTDTESFAVLEPTADGFRNYLQKGHELPAEHLLVDKAFMLTLSAPEMTALLGGMRVLNANAGQSEHGVFTDRPETLTNDFFVNLLDIATEWKATSDSEDVFEGRSRETGELRWTGTRVDLVFGSNSELRAIAEVYGSADAEQKFVRDFVAAWNKVMNLDRFDLA